MLKINLLPPYVYEGAKRRRAFYLWCCLVVLAAAAVGGMRWKLDQDAQAFWNAANEEKLEAEAAVRAETETNAVTAESAAVRAKVDFVSSAIRYDLGTYPPVVNNVRDYTIADVLYSSFAPQGNQISLSAYAPTLQDVGDYLLWMEHNPDITNVSISMNSIPGFPLPQDWYAMEREAKRNPGVGGHTFGVVLTRVKSLEAGPQYPPVAAAPAAGMGGMGAFPAPGGAMGAPGMAGGAGMQAPGGMGAGRARGFGRRNRDEE